MKAYLLILLLGVAAVSGEPDDCYFNRAGAEHRAAYERTSTAGYAGWGHNLHGHKGHQALLPPQCKLVAKQACKASREKRRGSQLMLDEILCKSIMPLAHAADVMCPAKPSIAASTEPSTEPSTRPAQLSDRDDP